MFTNIILGLYPPAPFSAGERERKLLRISRRQKSLALRRGI
jgi:hypothetical protein